MKTLNRRGMTLKNKALIAGIVGLLLPPYALYFESNTFFGSTKGIIAFAFFYAVGWVETSGFFFSEPRSELLFKVFDPNWYLAPNKIITDLNDVQQLVNWFLLDFYGEGSHGSVIQSTEGLLMGLALIILIAAVALSAIEKHEAAIVVYLLGILIQTAAFLNYYSNSSMFDSMIPIGVIAYIVAIVLEWKARA